MAQQVKATTSKRVTEQPTASEEKSSKREELLDDLDSLLDEVDIVLEENMRVERYVQKGGQ